MRGHVDDVDRDRRGGAPLDARRRLTVGQAVGAHVALADDAEPAIEDRDLVGTREGAVAAADALVVEVADDAGDRVLLVGVGRDNR